MIMFPVHTYSASGTTSLELTHSEEERIEGKDPNIWEKGEGRGIGHQPSVCHGLKLEEVTVDIMKMAMFSYSVCC